MAKRDGVVSGEPKEAERKVTTNKFFSKRNFPTIAQLACATHADEWAVGDFKSGSLVNNKDESTHPSSGAMANVDRRVSSAR